MINVYMMFECVIISIKSDYCSHSLPLSTTLTHHHYSVNIHECSYKDLVYKSGADDFHKSTVEDRLSLLSL